MNMMVTPHAPPPGSTSIGDLYVDLQSRTVWLGVDLAVDPNGAVLLSDILAIEPALDAAVALANDYTDDGVATRAPVVHTHTASQITDFENAVEAIVGGPGGSWATGQITMYWGAMSNIGVGALAGWALCDGSQGTPDLRDRFILGAGNRASGIVNTLTKATTNITGSHVHVVGGTAITAAQMPSHTHPVSGSGSGSGGTDAQGNHSHSTTAVTSGSGTPGLSYFNSGNVVGGFATSTAGNHAHNVSVTVSISGTATAVGGGATHTHTCQNEGDHSHEITSNNLREATPYMTMAFIMKL